MHADLGSRAMEGMRITGQMLTFRTSFAMQVLVAIDVADFAALRSQIHPTQF
jgi:hypothetical protein